MQRSTMQNAISAPTIGGIVRLTKFILKGTFIIEFLGALLMMPVFIHDFGINGLWMSVFHSISLFVTRDLIFWEAKTAFIHLLQVTAIIISLI